jgi:transporter family protein
MKPQLSAPMTAFCWGWEDILKNRSVPWRPQSDHGDHYLNRIAVFPLAISSYPRWKTLPQAGSKALPYRVIAFASPLFSALMGLLCGGEPLAVKIGPRLAMTVGGIVLLTLGWQSQGL